jgi:CDP-glucose 4,6-dehydratase
LLMLDIRRAKKELGWMPKLSSTEAIKWTVEWYKRKTVDQLKYSYQQIEEYFSL